MDISTNYLGLKLRSPLVVSASPLSEDIDNIKRMEDVGAGAVVLYSLFEEPGKSLCWNSLVFLVPAISQKKSGKLQRKDSCDSGFIIF